MRLALPCLLLVALAGAADAQPKPRGFTPPAESRTIPYDGAVPACGDQAVLAEIAWSFTTRERSYWASPLSIVDWAEPRETGYRGNGASYIPRRYCTALAAFNDGVRRRVGYNLGEDLGFAGLGWGVQWCVVGLDRTLDFAPRCEETQP